MRIIFFSRLTYARRVQVYMITIYHLQKDNIIPARKLNYLIDLPFLWNFWTKFISMHTDVAFDVVGAYIIIDMHGSSNMHTYMYIMCIGSRRYVTCLHGRALSRLVLSVRLKRALVLRLLQQLPAVTSGSSFRVNHSFYQRANKDILSCIIFLFMYIYSNLVQIFKFVNYFCDMVTESTKLVRRTVIAFVQ